MAKLTTEELLEQFAGLTLVELSEFVKAFEEKFDVTAFSDLFFIKDKMYIIF